MTPTQPEPKASRRGLWLVVIMVVGLLALSTWDIMRNSGGNSPIALRRAAFDGDEATVRRLITAHPEWIDLPGSTNGQSRTFADLYAKVMTAFGKSPASLSQDTQNAAFRELEGWGATSLFHAVAQRKTGIAVLLLESGANARARLGDGSPITAAAMLTGDTNLLSRLEQRGAKLDWHDPHNGLSALHLAVMTRQQPAVQFLLDRGLSPNSADVRGNTPLHFAAGGGQLDLVQLLLTGGADMKLTNRSGDSVLDATRLVAARDGDSNVVAVAIWLEAFAATNPPPVKPAPQ